LKDGLGAKTGDALLSVLRNMGAKVWLELGIREKGSVGEEPLPCSLFPDLPDGEVRSFGCRAVPIALAQWRYRVKVLGGKASIEKRRGSSRQTHLPAHSTKF